MSRTCPINTPRFRTRFGQVVRILCPVCFLVAAVCLLSAKVNAGELTNTPGVAVLLVDTERVMGNIETGVYGQFLEHINHSVVDGLFAEQIQGRGFEGNDFQTYWNPFATNGSASVVNAPFQSGEKSLRLQADNGAAGVRQGRIYLQQGYDYNGSVWIKPERGALGLTFRVMDSGGNRIATAPLKTSGLGVAGSRIFLFESANGYKRRNRNRRQRDGRGAGGLHFDDARRSADERHVAA